MQKIRKIFLLLSASAIILAGCTTKRSLSSTQPLEYVNAETIAGLPSITPDTLAMQYMSSNIKLDLEANGNSTSIKGKLRIKQGTGIQISISARGLMEAACIEFLPDKIRLINKLHKTYTEMSYSGSGAIGLSGINYRILESLFMNRVFLPDGNAAYTGLEDIAKRQKSNTIVLSTGNSSGMRYSFIIERRGGNLVASNGVSRSGESIKCSYSDFKEMNGNMFPCEMLLTFRGDEKLTLGIEHSKLSNKEFRFSTRKLNETYTELDIDDFIGSIEQHL